jgi:hypothetical protein
VTVPVIEGWLRYQSLGCGHVGSPLYEGLLARAADDFTRQGPTWRLLDGHEDDPGGSVLALRMMGAVHRLVLEGRAPELAERYGADDGDLDRTWTCFAATLEQNHERLVPLIERPVQTNEVGRCAALLPGFLGFAESSGLPLRLLEVGASAGLNLGWDAYRYEADGFAWGPPDSAMRIAFELSGGEMPTFEATVAGRIGCDPAPVDPGSEEGRLTLLSYVWPDQIVRMERLRAALDLAASAPPEVERASAVDWSRRRLEEPGDGLATVIFHSVVMQYLSDQERDAFEREVEAAGERASAAAPLAWLRMEPDGDRAAIRITTWPGGEERLLARAGYHGNPVELRA